MYIEGDVPFVSNNNGNGMWGQDGIWAILLLALLGNGGGFGFGGRNVGGTYSEALGYELGKVATTNDVASGFSTSTIMSNINDLKLGQSQMQNFVNQGFAGLNTTYIQGTNTITNAINTLGYQTQSCCCDIKGILLENRYLNEKQTCDLITNANANTQRIIDYMQTEKINSLTAENVALKGQISNSRQTADIVSALSPCPKPAFLVPNPNCCYQQCGVSVQ